MTLFDGAVLPATGVGSLPGDDPMEACKLVFGELPDLPHVPELPGRGPGADMIGRGASFLTDLWVDLQPSGWRFVPREGVDSRRAADFLARDLDALEEVADGWQGPLKIQAAGPWTLAAGIELQRGDRALADPGAVRDIAESLADGLGRHTAEIRRRIPGITTLLVQLDEPSLPAALAGHLPTASGFAVLPAVEGQTALAGLRTVVMSVSTNGARVGVHCCAPDVPIRLLTEAGAAFLGVDVGLLRARDDDPLGEAIDAGVGILLGAVPAVPDSSAAPSSSAPPTASSSAPPAASSSAPPAASSSAPPTASSSAPPKLSEVGRTVDAVRSLWRRVGFGADRMREVAAVTPTCGLAGAGESGARAAMRACREAARALSEEGS